MVPPLTSQYLNRSSRVRSARLAYPEIVQIFAGTVLNQSGRAIEVMFLVMVIFLIINLLMSAFMNWDNRRGAGGAMKTVRTTPLEWVRKNLFSSVANTVLTLLMFAFFATILPPLYRWDRQRDARGHQPHRRRTGMVHAGR